MQLPVKTMSPYHSCNVTTIPGTEVVQEELVSFSNSKPDRNYKPPLNERGEPCLSVSDGFRCFKTTSLVSPVQHIFESRA
ncbi:hypothetical protein NPIL_241521 [Nephila pilipes]|uniref:Uncharacterized protein n=1 Tax=Nephila pilipes TaxID=299642 RepID=A0A8X6TJR2_NEPPI|nr:hypothetical protein NPIL_241521 [Nephila pilipes]